MFFLFSSCNETKEIDRDNLGYDFYPLSIGSYSIYDVEEIRYLIAGFDTSNYQLREIIIDSINSIDQTSYLLRREIRQDQTEPWRSDSVWVITQTDNFLSVTENNIPFIKLTFPVSLDREWDGNSLNSRNSTTYYYQEVQNAIIDSIPELDHIRVIIEDIDENVTGVDLRSEIYVRGVGLVEKNYFTQKNCTASDCGADLGEVIAGRSLKQILIERGNEE
ncbi:MAG: hypothetical protein AAFY41_01370 [Bacteroidota bacterium]